MVYSTSNMYTLEHQRHVSGIITLSCIPAVKSSLGLNVVGSGWLVAPWVNVSVHLGKHSFMYTQNDAATVLVFTMRIESTK